MDEIYVSTDVESDGPIPGPHSMLSFASAAYCADGTLLGIFEATVQPLPDAAPHPDTARWWEQHLDAWRDATRDPQPPEQVMVRYVAWLDELPGKPVPREWFGEHRHTHRALDDAIEQGELFAAMLRQRRHPRSGSS